MTVDRRRNLKRFPKLTREERIEKQIYLVMAAPEGTVKRYMQVHNLMALVPAKSIVRITFTAAESTGQVLRQFRLHHTGFATATGPSRLTVPDLKRVVDVTISGCVNAPIHRESLIDAQALFGVFLK